MEGSRVPVAVIGAGPYGLSIAAHLGARGIEYRNFGRPMEAWSSNMPRGMLLKSEGFASNLYDPAGLSTLKKFCIQNNMEYADTGVPIPAETLGAYGVSFQKQYSPRLEDRRLEALDPAPNGFRLRFDDGDTLVAKRVILAIGCGYFRHMPADLQHLPPEFLSHSADHHDLSSFKGRDVTVLGGGASAFDLAYLLDEAGAQVRIVARQPSLLFHSKEPPRTAWRNIRYPLSGIGPGWRNCFYSGMPMAFRYLSRETRQRIVRTHLGPAGAWWVRDRIVGRVPLHPGCSSVAAETRGGRVQLRLGGADGVPREVITDHVIAATGFKVDINRLGFLHDRIRMSLRSVDGSPVLSRNFESSVPGLHFAGVASAVDYGPVMRFMCGAGYAARRIAAHMANGSS